MLDCKSISINEEGGLIGRPRYILSRYAATSRYLLQIAQTA
jgi:hypothetical protein